MKITIKKSIRIGNIEEKHEIIAEFDCSYNGDLIVRCADELIKIINTNTKENK